MYYTFLFIVSVIGTAYHIASVIVYKERKIDGFRLTVSIFGAIFGIIAVVGSFYLMQSGQGVIQSISFD